MINQAFLLCAGRATRMGQHTKKRPKCLLDVAGRPALAHMFDWLKANGFTSVVMNVSHCYEQVLDYLAENDPGLRVHCSVEFGDPLGTARGVKNAYHLLAPTFALVYGDVVTNMDLRALCDQHDQQGGTVTIASYLPPNPQDCGLLATTPDGYVTFFVEKPPVGTLPGWPANTGIMVCEQRMFEHVPMNHPTDIGRDLLPDLIQLGHVVGHRPLAEGEYLYDIGTPANYEACCKRLSNA